MDFSLQLASSLQNFYSWKAQQEGLFESAYNKANGMMEKGTTKKANLQSAAKVQPIKFPY